MTLNNYLLPTDSPIAQNQVISAYDFNALNERGIVVNQFVADNSISTTKIANLAVTNAKIVNIDASKINAGTVVVGLNLGSTASGYLLLDGANNRLIVNDGTTNRIVIGNV